MDGQNTAQQPADEVQVSVSFWTKLGDEFRVPEAPIVSETTECICRLGRPAPCMLRRALHV
jgi:hypothetical protein